MEIDEFVNSLSNDDPPKGLNPFLMSLWYDGKEEWEASHSLIQDIAGKDAARIHAYLHRKEGDIWNASYWYRNAGTELPATDIKAEWIDLVRLHLLKKS